MMDPQSLRLDIKFKGSRTYLHGTDLFDAMMALNLSAPGAVLSNIRMSFYRPITRSVVAHRLVSRQAVTMRPAALFELKVDGEPAVWALEEAAEEVAGRRPYDEAEAIAGAAVQNGTISQPRPTAFSFIERLVALNKHLLGSVRAGEKVDWWFARLELSTPPPPAPALRLTLETALGGRLMKSSVEVDGTWAGSIYFSEKKAP